MRIFGLKSWPSVVRRLPAWAIDWLILRPMRLATGGTALACRLALEHGVAVNLGGYHHAAGGWGGGFCVYEATPRCSRYVIPPRLKDWLAFHPEKEPQPWASAFRASKKF